MQHTWSPVVLALASCRVCAGTGRAGRRGEACDCVYRRIFRGCLKRYRELRARASHGVRFERMPGAVGGVKAGLPGVEYMADFDLVARRELAALEYSVFRHHFLEGLEWTDCLPLAAREAAPLTRGNFFHTVYRVEQQLGRAFTQVAPYTLWPRDYFAAWKLDPLRTLRSILPPNYAS